LPKHLSLKFINALCDHRGTFTSLRLTENSEHSLHISPLFFFRRIWIIMIQLTFHDAVDTAGMKSYLLHTATSFFLLHVSFMISDTGLYTQPQLSMLNIRLISDILRNHNNRYYLINDLFSK